MRGRRRAGLAGLLLWVAIAAPAAPAAPADPTCPGADPACPYAGAPLVVGQRGEGVLRFPQTVAVGPDGAVYVGDQASHVVQVFSADGTFLREVGVAGTRPGELGAVGAIAVAPDGTLLVADAADRIDRFGADGGLLGSFGGPGDAVGQFDFGAGGGHDSPAGGGLAVSGDTLYVADSRNDRIQRFSLDGGHGAEIVGPGLLANPRGLAVRGTRLVVADDRHHRLVVLDTGGRLLRTVGDGRGPRPGQLDSPFGVAIDPRGRVFVADDLNHRVVRFSGAPAYPYKARWGSFGTGAGQLAFPRGIATDASGAVYVADTGNDRIDVYDAAGVLRRSFGASGRGPGEFDGPTGVAADASGIRAVADTVNGRLELLHPDGTVAAIWGSPSPGPTLLRAPVAVAFDAAGDAYALDQRRGDVVVFERATGLPARSFGRLGSGPGELLQPDALSLDGAGRAYVADAGNRRVARFDAGGGALGSFAVPDTPRGIAVTPDASRIYVSDARDRISAYTVDGTRVARFGGIGTKLGKLAAPAQMTLDGAGDLWVADSGHNRVQEFGPDGQRLAAFGTRGTGPGQFIHPTGVSVDCTGTLSVTDSANNRVQQFALAAPPPGACLGLAPPATPPPPRAFRLPVPVGPAVAVEVLRTGDLLARGLPLRVSCDTGCSVSLTAEATPRARPRRGRSRISVPLGAAARVLPAADPQIVRAMLRPPDGARLRRALGRLRGVAVDVRITATATAGPPTTVERRIEATA